MLLLITSLLLFAATSSAADINEAGGARNGYFILGRQIQFDCDYENTAFTFESFGHNGTLITAGGRFYIQDSVTHHSLVVSNTVPSDSGTWSCTLRSIQNQRTITRSTTVIYEETIRLTPKESSIVGPYQRPYTITCRGENIRTWQWIHNNAIVRNSSDGRVQVWSRGRIHFTSLRYEDIGVYYCKTGNFFQYDVFGTYRLTVNALPVVKVVKQPSNIIKANDSVNITCTASGVGLQSVTWSKESDGAQLVSNSDHNVTIVHNNDTSITSVLRFSAVTGSQQDTYRCNATSNAGSSYNFTEISLSGLPGAPPAPSLSIINVTMVMVRWESPNDTGKLDISQFQINYGKVEERGKISPLNLELPAHHVEYVFPLLLATRYYFSVAAMNEHGRGPFSEQNEITTNSTTPLGLTVTVINVTTTSVLLSWQSLTGNDTGGSPIIGYIITYYYTAGSEKNVSIDVSEDVDGYWLTGLMDNREYHVMICAMNINGCGEQSSLVDFVTPLSLPDPVDTLNITAGGKDDKLITISWTANASNAEVHYLIRVTSEEGVVTSYNFTTSMITVDGTMYSVNVPQLESNKCYGVSVTAVNEKGNSTPVSTNITCINVDKDSSSNVEGGISVSGDDELSSSTIITIAVPAVALLILVILVVAVSIYILRRCMRYKRADMELGTDYKNQKRGSEASTAPLNLSYQRNDSTDTQDSVASQLSTITNDSYISESLPFRMSNNGLLDTIKESPSYDELASSEAAEDLKWTEGPAITFTAPEGQQRSPMTIDPTQPFIYNEPMVYTDNAAYFSVSHEYKNKPADYYSEVKIVPDSRNDGKEVVVLPQKR